MHHWGPFAEDLQTHSIPVPTMSQELESSARLSTSKAIKKSRNGNVDRSDRKRKRKQQDDSQGPSPKKKHRVSKQTSTDPAPTETPTIPPISPDSSIGSSFHQQTSSLYLPLSPISQAQPLQGLCAEHLSPLILTYYPPFHGIILSYSNARLSSSPTATPQTEDVLARSIDEYAANFIWVTADFLLFKPETGNVLEGWINLQNEGNVGLVCLNFFNASIERNRLPKEWNWVTGGARAPQKSNKGDLDAGGLGTQSKQEEPRSNGLSDIEGYFEDGSGNPVGGLIRFRVKDIETPRSASRENGFLSIEGTMLNEELEKQLQEQEAIRVQCRDMKRPGRSREPQHAMSGAVANRGARGDEDGDGIIKIKSKHRVKY